MVFKLFPLALAVALAACVVGPERLDVTGTPDDLRFTAVERHGHDPVCAQDLIVAPVVPESADDADVAWHVHSLGLDTCFDTLRYGEIGARILQEVAATPLRPSVLYRARLSGPSFSVTRDFRLTPQGVKVEPAPHFP